MLDLIQEAIGVKEASLPTVQHPIETSLPSPTSEAGQQLTASTTTPKSAIAVDSKIKSHELQEGRALRENDVVCEKGRGDHERWPGNKLYRNLIRTSKDAYNDLPPMHRSRIICKMTDEIREKDGWFVHIDEATGLWSELHQDKVRKKISDDLRREIRRKREKRASNTMCNANLQAISEQYENPRSSPDILQTIENPNEVDVLFGVGARRHPGNKSYWHLMEVNLEKYIISPYGARSMISRSIVEGIKEQNGRFLEQDPKSAVWYEISNKRAVEKTSHALSNKKYKSKKKVPECPRERQLREGNVSCTSTPTSSKKDGLAIKEAGAEAIRSPATIPTVSAIPSVPPESTSALASVKLSEAMPSPPSSGFSSLPLQQAMRPEEKESSAPIVGRGASKKFRFLQRVATEMREEIARQVPMTAGATAEAKAKLPIVNNLHDKNGGNESRSNIKDDDYGAPQPFTPTPRRYQTQLQCTPPHRSSSPTPTKFTNSYARTQFDAKMIVSPDVAGKRESPSGSVSSMQSDQEEVDPNVSRMIDYAERKHDHRPTVMVERNRFDHAGQSSPFVSISSPFRPRQSYAYPRDHHHHSQTMWMPAAGHHAPPHLSRPTPYWAPPLPVTPNVVQLTSSVRREYYDPRYSYENY